VVDCFTWLLQSHLVRQGLQRASKNVLISQRAVTQVCTEFDVVGSLSQWSYAMC